MGGNISSLVITWLISSVFLRHSAGDLSTSTSLFHSFLLFFLLSIPWSLLTPCSLSPFSLYSLSSFEIAPSLRPILYLSILDPLRGQGEALWVDPFSLLLSIRLSLFPSLSLRTLWLENFLNTNWSLWGTTLKTPRTQYRLKDCSLDFPSIFSCGVFLDPRVIQLNTIAVHVFFAAGFECCLHHLFSRSTWAKEGLRKELCLFLW